MINRQLVATYLAVFFITGLILATLPISYTKGASVSGYPNETLGGGGGGQTLMHEI